MILAFFHPPSKTTEAEFLLPLLLPLLLGLGLGLGLGLVFFDVFSVLPST